MDEIGSRLLFVVDLLDEFEVHFGREPGSPGFIREDPTVHVSPIEQFVLVLFQFWTNTTGRPFGHGTKEPQFAGTGVATTKGGKAKGRKEVDAKPDTSAMHFLYAAQEVLAREYDAATLSGVVRKIKVERKRDLLATDGSIQSPLKKR